MPVSVPEAGMRPGALNLVLTQGMTIKVRQTWTDEQVPPQPLNLTGYKIRLSIKRKLSDAVALLALSSETATPFGSTIDMTDAALGIIWVTFSDEDTAALPAMSRTPDKRGHWDEELESPAGEVPLKLQGRVEVPQEVSR